MLVGLATNIGLLCVLLLELTVAAEMNVATILENRVGATRLSSVKPLPKGSY
jgi:hypothetical protein